MTKGKASVPKVVKMRRQKIDNAAENDIKNIYNFFIESNCFPFQSLFFQQSSYLTYDVHAKTAPKRLLNKFAKISTKHYLQRNVFLSISLELKKWKNLSLELVCLFGILFHIPVKTLNISNFRKKIKSLLLNTLDKEDNYSNVTYLIENSTKLTYLHCDFSLFFLITKPLCLSLWEGSFLSCVVVILFFSFFLNR